VPKVSKNSKDTGSRVAGRAGPFGAHYWAPRECGCMRLAYGTSACVVCGASVCVVLRHHWALNEHVHACA